jgi:tRNA pseudouridine38-40 synthase
MPRYTVGIEYDGSQFSGFQSQPALATVQGALEQALSQVAGEPVACVAAGRTDAGVHAAGQVVHFDTSVVRTERSWRLGGNSNLPASVSIAWAREVPPHFHARYSARARSYRYCIFNRDSRSALVARRATWLYKPLDADRMHAAAQALRGEHDFSAFRAIECQAKSPIRELTQIAVARHDVWVTLDVTANAFLHHMVRNIAGLLIAVGCGDSPVERVATVLASRDRKQNAATAPPDGLYLLAVDYPREFGLPEPRSFDPRELGP